MHSSRYKSFLQCISIVYSAGNLQFAIVFRQRSHLLGKRSAEKVIVLQFTEVLVFGSTPLYFRFTKENSEDEKEESSEAAKMARFILIYKGSVRLKE